MKCIAIDIGNGFTKAVSDEKKIRFPSLASKNKSSKWSDKSEEIGYAAAKKAGNYNTHIISPVIAGKAVSKEEYGLLIKEALKKLEVNPGDEFSVCAGLPYDERKQKKVIVSQKKVC